MNEPVSENILYIQHKFSDDLLNVELEYTRDEEFPVRLIVMISRSGTIWGRVRFILRAVWHGLFKDCSTKYTLYYKKRRALTMKDALDRLDLETENGCTSV